MRQHHIGAIVVVDSTDKERPVGIVTDRDLVLELMAEGLDPAIFTAGDIMSVDLVSASPDMSLMDAVLLMKTHRLRRLIVCNKAQHLVGIVTVEDVLERMSSELSSLVAGLAGARDREISERP